jgi:hypothetical protein
VIKQSLGTPQVSQLEGGWMNARFAVLRLRHRVECIRLESDRFIANPESGQSLGHEFQNGGRFFGNGLIYRLVDGKRKSQRGGKQESM